MTIRKPLVLVSGSSSELPPGDSVEGVALTTTLTAGSGLSGGGFLSANSRVDVSLAAAPSGLIFVGNQLGLDGTAQASGNAALVSASSRLSTAGGTLSGTLTISGSVIASGSVSDTAGNVRTIPQTSVAASSYILTVGDIGKHISIASGVITIPNSVFVTGDAVSIYNNSSGVQNISGDVGTTLRKAGAATTGQQTVAQYGLTTVLCVSSGIFVLAGAGVN